MTDAEFREWLDGPEGIKARAWCAENGLMLIYPSVAKMLAEYASKHRPRRKRGIDK